ncbi:heavy-metal-associated domain-containing protein [Ectobacillus ponti]|uniref:Heavy-metal-associated domain-containing protein n=1 Tax=Ectobacillus ponti TaxID=2961894 RepID=A0AA41XB19_9BACI|nr:heavy-metal-associated domain-containing protein [Ectobacillus ponti]MCP8969578.1 heavy-metal-associated domain-containing protein [Ectobacillus ponti]
METGLFHIPEMNSERDADKVRQVLHEVWGIRRTEVNVRTKEAYFSYDEQAASCQDFEQALADVGFTVQRVENNGGE